MIHFLAGASIRRLGLCPGSFANAKAGWFGGTPVAPGVIQPGRPFERPVLRQGGIVSSALPTAKGPADANGSQAKESAPRAEKLRLDAAGRLPRTRPALEVEGDMKRRNAPAVGSMRARGAIGAALLGWALGLGGAPVQAKDLDTASAITEITLEDLLNTEVTSVSKKAQRLSETASAIHVITDDTIRRSGLHSIPEILRLAPGVNVARVSATEYAISIRGMEQQYSNKLLVMVDGRSVYTPTFGGVKWESLHVPIEDIERIEVIRGPGATVWGANAVNGVINILTKSTEDTQGTLVSPGAGTEEHAFGTLRHGGKVGETLGYRVSIGYLDRDHTLRRGEHDASSNQGRVGTAHTRLDWTPSERDQVTFTGSYFQQDLRTSNFSYALHPMIPGFLAGQSVVHGQHENWGGNGNFDWTRKLDEDQSIELAGYVDVERSDTFQVGETRRTMDLTLQHNWKLADADDFLWGLGWRQNDSRTDEGAPGLSFRKENRREVIWSGFGQLEHVLVPELLTATVGSKVEWNDITGWELQPSARMLWTPNDWNQVWASVSRSVRTPTRADRDIDLIAAAIPVAPGLYAPFTIVGDEDLGAEVMLAYEIGYRVQPSSKVSIDSALFFNDYDNMITTDTPLSPTSLTFDNRSEARVYGAEVEATWQVRNDWRLTGSWTGQRVQERGMRRNMGLEGKTPRHQMQLHSYLNVTEQIELDLGLYYTGRRAFKDAFGSYRIGSHWRTDLRLGWKPCERLEVAVGVQDLFDRRHSEFRGDYIWPPEIQQVEVQRNVYGQVRWAF